MQLARKNDAQYRAMQQVAARYAPARKDDAIYRALQQVVAAHKQTYPKRA